MNFVDNFVILTLRFKYPSKVFYVNIKGHNTHKIEISFYDLKDQFLLMKGVTLTLPDQEKILDVWERPLTAHLEVKLFNNPQLPLKLGLNYLGFEGQAVKPKP